MPRSKSFCAMARWASLRVIEEALARRCAMLAARSSVRAESDVLRMRAMAYGTPGEFGYWVKHWRTASRRLAGSAISIAFWYASWSADGWACAQRLSHTREESAMRHMSQDNVFWAAPRSLLRQPCQEQSIGLHVFPIRYRQARNRPAVPLEQLLQFAPREPLLPIGRLQP